jgi:hypothetical protein
MPASFDDQMTIDEHDEHRCLVSVGGPLGLDAGDTVLRLDFWILQNMAACVGVLQGSNVGLDVDGDKWRIEPDPHEAHFGNGFQPGVATAVGMMIKENAAEQVIVEKWERTIVLLGGGGGQHQH